MDNVVLITGATGNVGAEVVRLLRSAGHPIKAAVRKIDQASNNTHPQTDHVAFDFGRPQTFEAALQGVGRLFLVRPPAISDVERYIHPFVDVAKTAGVRHIVFLSLLGAERNRFVPHAKIETHIKSSGVPYTFLRASFFMQNLSTTHRDEIKERDEIIVPAGHGRTSFIDARDIAEVAAKTLTEEGHENRAYDLTGDEALTYYEVADLFTEALGRKISYCNPSIFRFAARRYRGGESISFIAVMIGIYTTVRLGLAARVSEDARTILQRRTINMRKFIGDHREYWVR